ncbi:FAD-dependent oxidoreductase [Mucilaginibacter sabulilitoris]|uniref:FAD-dependent oxidoreductase n=1 Tax=Mucilaginibacter sabulilitoris TaxID=1173583 RepID=A0ABZ0TRW9_9SPHI|nr:FAD-dependent oxidoreductase [Mucilaginibacter sabulilitoris]WPU94818.1 FAD-dependent oxidoreductase [Mucilaginibacter sabulilitoris]
MSEENTLNQYPDTEEYDLVVLGSGAAGKLISWTLGKKGMKIAVVERQYVGGACPNIACLPSKNIIHSAKVANYVRQSESFGITKEKWQIDMSAVRERKRRMVTDLVNIHHDLYKQSGVDLIMGEGQFVAPKTLSVKSSNGGVRILKGKRIVINTGTHAAIGTTPGLQDANPLTHVEALELNLVPEHFIILGGGFVGIEFAQAMRRFGSKVTLIERNGSLIHREDDDISEELYNVLSEEGVDIITSAHIVSVEGKSGQFVKINYMQKDMTKVIEGSHLMVAAGRIPNTSGIGLELAGIEVTRHGYIKVNDRLETTATDVWAAGECAGSPHFTHISENDFHVVVDNILGGNKVTTGRQVPFCMFTDPELARIGLSEKEAQEQGVAYRLAKIPFGAILRTRTLSETKGFMKALVDTESDRILGFCAFGVEAGELLAPVQVVMSAQLPYTILRDMIFSHPTMAEGLNSLFGSVPAR